MTTHRKIKSVAKMMVPSGPKLDELVLDTMKVISSLVGSTLGPGGKVVGIERQEFGIPDLVTKDGVTVFRNMGFDNPVKHSIMGLARDAAVRTATEAGDGTTGCTVLAEAFVRYVHGFCKDNPKASSQRVVRIMQALMKDQIEPFIRSLKITPDTKVLKAVALCSTNSDVELTKAVAECFELTGDEGNVTLTEASGPSGYKVEALKGYPVSIGYEDCVSKFFSVFLNDTANNRVYLEKPVFVLFNGMVQDLTLLYPILHKIGEKWGGPSKNDGPRNIVVVATGFGDIAVGQLADNWPDPMSLNIYPLTAPRNAMVTGQMDFLLDLAAVTGSTVLDPINRLPGKAGLEDVGPELEYFEATRYRSTIIGQADEGLVLARLEEIDVQLPQSEGIAETSILNERKGKLSGGIAKLIISAPTSGELREKRDRAEDAAMAWRGAVTHGALPGGGWTLLKICQMLQVIEWPDSLTVDIVRTVMVPALETPVRLLLTNCGYSVDEIESRIEEMKGLLDEDEPVIFDALEGTFKVASESGVIDSLPAVLEAVRNSMSIATQLGTLGGVIVFPRDVELERQEAGDAYEYYKTTGMA